MKPKHPLLSDALDAALRRGASLKPRTKVAYREVWVAYIAEHKSPRRPNGPRTNWPSNDNASEWVAKMVALMHDGKLSPLTIRTRVAAMRTLYDLLHEGGIAFGENPFGRLRLPRIPHREPRTITSEQFDAILAAAPEAAWCRPFLLVLGHAGLRCEEARTLKVANISLAAGKITVIGKGDKERRVPITPQLEAALAAYLPTLTGQFVFPSPYSPREAISTTTIRNLVDGVCAKTGITADGQKVTPHTFRRLLTQLIAEAGGDVAVMCKVLGHSKPTTTLISYHAAAQSRVDATMKRVGAQQSTTPKGGE